MPTPATWPARLAVLLLCPDVFAAPVPFPRPHRPLSKDQLAGPHTLASLPLHQARQLHGQRATYRVVLDSPGDPEGEHDVYVCKGAGNIERTLWLPADEETEDEMVVEAVLLVIEHKEKITATGERFEGFTEYRLTRAQQCQSQPL
jgi:hypothetical protein